MDEYPTLYHWSHTSRRKAINRMGLMPNSWSRDRLWKPAYVCLAPTPAVGWALSGGMNHEYDKVEWDLWEVSFKAAEIYNVTERYFHDSGRLCEVRVHERIYKRHVFYLASRDCSPPCLNPNTV